MPNQKTTNKEKCDLCKKEPAQINGLCKECCPCCEWEKDQIIIEKHYLFRLLELVKEIEKKRKYDHKIIQLIGSVLEDLVK